MSDIEIHDDLFGQLHLEWEDGLEWWEGSINVEGRSIKLNLNCSKPDEIPEPIRELFRVCQTRKFDYRDAIIKSNIYNVWGMDEGHNEHVGEVAFFAAVRLDSISVWRNEITLWHEQSDDKNSRVNLGGHWITVELKVDGSIGVSVEG